MDLFHMKGWGMMTVGTTSFTNSQPTDNIATCISQMGSYNIKWAVSSMSKKFPLSSGASVAAHYKGVARIDRWSLEKGVVVPPTLFD